MDLNFWSIVTHKLFYFIEKKSTIPLNFQPPIYWNGIASSAESSISLLKIRAEWNF